MTNTRIYDYLAALLLIISLGLVIQERNFIRKNLGVYVVTSGSMSPAVSPGSLVLSRKGDYKDGDIVVFVSPESSDILTHRIVGFSQDLKKVKTKGDANAFEDPGIVDLKNIIGKVYLIIPCLGYGVDFLGRKPVFLALVYCISGVVCFIELKKILKS